ncbi:winged helix-turn-helix domain-containing tetratricopeptide repeat protein [Erythrobacter sp. MTPC3]|uniref:winged helix-turn-helix domain-containing tetratricopeptide repeat protein n=1 Tax=Erythrobacter sp. MTPC3 TaxID=3056564 RepID=UPI0036F3C173
MIYRFGAFTFDSDKYELVDAAGEVIHLQPRTKELLHLFLETGTERLLSKTRIAETLWDGRGLSNAALLSQIKSLRRALDDTGRPRTVIETVHAKGWRLVPEIVSSMRLPAAPVQQTDSSERPGGPEKIGERPSIAVLPFTHQLLPRSPYSGMAVALPDDIITALSRLHLLSVIARGTSFQFGGSSIAPSALRELLGVDYVLSGVIDVAGEHLILSVELADAHNDRIVWAERFEVAPDAVHEIRSHITGRVVHEIERQVPRNEAERLRLSAPHDLTAWQAFHLGSSLLYRRGIANIERAQGLFQRAVAIDPDFARAHAGLSHTYWWLLLQRTLHDPGDAPLLMRRSAEAAIDADPDDPAANLAMGKALSLGPQREQSPEWLERSIELSPSYAMGHTQLAAFHAFAGPYEDAMEHGASALSLSPRDPMRYSTYAAQAIAQFNLGDIQAAAHWGRMAQSVPHEDLMIMVTALCAIFVSGEKEEAAEIADHIRNVFPKVTIAGIERANPYMGERVRPVVQAILSANGFS